MGHRVHPSRVVRRLAVVLAALSPLSLSTAVHADEGIIDQGDSLPGESITYTYADGAPTVANPDPIAVTFNYGLTHMWCAPTNPTNCFPDSTLGFWISINLGYRNHQMRARTGILSGGRAWIEWYSKLHTVTCKQNDGDQCGPGTVLPVAKAWSPWQWYVTSQFPNPGYFQMRYSACLDGTCGYSIRRTLPVYCRPRREQCYFDI